MTGADRIVPAAPVAAPAAANVAAAAAAAPSTVMFMPWVRLDDAATVNGITFVPWKDAHGAVTAALHAASDVLDTILGAYVDVEGTPITNCVVATIAGRGALLSDEDYESARTAASLLFLSSWAMNQYHHPFAGRYVNAANFRLIAQKFTGQPVWIGLVSRHRDGIRVNGGYTHDALSFAVPLQCFPVQVATVDRGFLAALDVAVAANSRTAIDTLRALPFVELANTDDDFMSAEAEAILMGSAFEQLLRGGGKAYILCRKFGILFNDCGSVRVTAAIMGHRPGIVIEEQYFAAQQLWWTHRKWIEELYDLRSKAVHGGARGHRTWGWTPLEHLLMAAVAFPLAVKLLLQRDGHYAFTDDDRALCKSMDRLLATPDFQCDPEHDGALWHRIIEDEQHLARLRARLLAAGHTL